MNLEISYFFINIVSVCILFSKTQFLHSEALNGISLRSDDLLPASRLFAGKNNLKCHYDENFGLSF